MKRIAVLTSGGDAPGMNAAIRAVARVGLDKGWEVFGVERGYAGLVAGQFVPLGPRDVGGIIQRGGTLLGTARSDEFRTEAGRDRSMENLDRQGIHGLVVIGGNGSQAGAHLLHQMGAPVVGIASTIDNDLHGADITLGVDTALNIALEAVDRIKITASSHNRVFVVEVMGRDSGYLALMTALAGGAEAVVIPEVEIRPEDVVREIAVAYERGKAHAIIVVAEGAKHNAQELVRYVGEHRRELGFELRATILGHVQRGGSPGAWDRLLGTRLGAAAIDSLQRKVHGVMVGLLRGDVVATPLAEVATTRKSLDLDLLELAQVLARH